MVLIPGWSGFLPSYDSVPLETIGLKNNWLYKSQSHTATLLYMTTAQYMYPLWKTALLSDPTNEVNFDNRNWTVVTGFHTAVSAVESCTVEPCTVEPVSGKNTNDDTVSADSVVTCMGPNMPVRVFKRPCLIAVTYCAGFHCNSFMQISRLLY